MNAYLSRLVILVIAFCASVAQAAFHQFKVDQVYSNADGSVQYVVLKESNNSNGQNVLSGHTFATTNAAGQMKQMNFPSNLPSNQTAGRYVLIATPGFAALPATGPSAASSSRGSTGSMRASP